MTAWMSPGLSETVLDLETNPRGLPQTSSLSRIASELQVRKSATRPATISRTKIDLSSGPTVSRVRTPVERETVLHLGIPP